jgi:hypothetical protein
MPPQETGKNVSRMDGTRIRPMVRNHQIAIYSDAALSKPPDSTNAR